MPNAPFRAPFTSYLAVALLVGALGCQQDDGPAGLDDGGDGPPPGDCTVTVPPAGHRGDIAYVRGRSEIRLIAADGTNDRRIWAHPQGTAAGELGISGLSWRPDGGEIAFSSGHESATSLREVELWATTPDGGGVRKLTNPPANAGLSCFPQGTVTVTVRRGALDTGGPEASGTYTVYVVGAREAQNVVLPPGGEQTLTFTNVADFGSGVVQPVVAMYAGYRWLAPGADVRPAATEASTALDVTGVDLIDFRAVAPGWRSDGSQVGFVLGNCAGLYRVAVNAAPSDGADRMGTNDNLDTCAWDWGPAGAHAGEVLHTAAFDDFTVYLMPEGGGPRTPVVQFESTVLDVRWLPDGSGFIADVANGSYTSSNLYRYDFASQQKTQLTTLDNEVIRSFAVSPDGQSVVLERAQSLFNEEVPSELWVMAIDGGDLRLLVHDGQAPAW